MGDSGVEGSEDAYSHTCTCFRLFAELPCGGVYRTASVFQPEVQVQGGEAGAGGAEGGETEPPDTTVQGGGVLVALQLLISEELLPVRWRLGEKVVRDAAEVSAGGQARGVQGGPACSSCSTVSPSRLLSSYLSTTNLDSVLAARPWVRSEIPLSTSPCLTDPSTPARFLSGQMFLYLPTTNLDSALIRPPPPPWAPT